MAIKTAQRGDADIIGRRRRHTIVEHHGFDDYEAFTENVLEAHPDGEFVGSLDAGGKTLPLYDLDRPVIVAANQITFTDVYVTARTARRIDRRLRRSGIFTVFNDNLVRTSRSTRDVPMPLTLTIAAPATLVGSSTDGHHHLYVNAITTQRNYFSSLKTLSAAGAVDAKWAALSAQRRIGVLRHPDSTKNSDANQMHSGTRTI